jgi:signal transduction histidine kinase
LAGRTRRASPAPQEPEASALLGAAAHEIKNVLGPLGITLQKAERRVLAGEAIAREELAFARTQVRRLSQLVNDLLDVARLDLSDLPIRARPGDLAAAAREATDVFGHGSARAVTLELPGEPVSAEFDPDRLLQVLLNLLDNADKYAPAPAPITVSVARAPRGARLEVRDAGPGLSAADQRAIFRRFVRARVDGDGTRGLGLGLYLCRAIVERHGGRLGVDSAPGRGATFWLELPSRARRR